MTNFWVLFLDFALCPVIESLSLGLAVAKHEIQFIVHIVAEHDVYELVFHFVLEEMEFLDG